MEFLDVINDNDEVVGNAPKKDIYEKLLPHRIVHIFVFNRNGELALQLQAKEKKFCPLHWVSTAGGHVQAGESAEKAAARELEEEAGIKPHLDFIGKDWYAGPKGIRKLLFSFKTYSEGPFTPRPGEVDRVEFFSLERIREIIAAGEKFHPELLFLLGKRFGFEQPF